MPKRPRQHQLESESRAAFRRAIPARWLFRDYDQDYGIDGEVEIFDRDGEATGIKFLVQLKAADAVRDAAVRRLHITHDKAKYYRALGLPVLIAKYHAPTGRLFVRWFHALDPYHGRRSADGTSYSLTDEDISGDGTPDRVEAEARARRALGVGLLREPLDITLIITGEPVEAFATRSRFRDVAFPFGRVMRLVEPSAGAPMPNRISVSPAAIEIVLAGGQVVTLHTRSTRPPDLEAASLVLFGLHSTCAQRLASRSGRTNRWTCR